MKQKTNKRIKTNNPNNTFICEICDYVTSNRQNYERHLGTKKHVSNVSKSVSKVKQKGIKQFLCPSCGVDFKSRTSLWRHKKKCTGEKCPKVENEEKSPENFYLKKIAALEAKLEKVELAQKNPHGGAMATPLKCSSSKAAWIGFHTISSTKSKIIYVYIYIYIYIYTKTTKHDVT